MTNSEQMSRKHVHVPEDTAGRIEVLNDFGFTAGDRDPRMNTDFDGAFMVSGEIPDGYAGQKDGSDGEQIWCIVGDDLPALVDEAISHVSSFDADFIFDGEDETPVP